MNFFIYYLFIVLANSRFSRSILMIFTMGSQISFLQFSVIQMGYFASRFLFEFPSGVIADYIKRKYSLAFGNFLASLVAMTMFSTSIIHPKDTFIFFLLLFCLDGIASSFQSGSDEALLYDYLLKKKQESRYAKILGWRSGIAALVLSIATMIGGFMADSSLALPFLFQGILSVAAGVVILFFPENAMGSKNSKAKHTSPFKIAAEGFSVIKTIPLVQFLILFITIISCSTNAITMFMQGYFAELKISSGMVGIIYGVCTLFSTVAAINSHHLIKLSLKTILILSTIMYFSGIVLLFTHNIPLVILGFFLIYIKLDLMEPSVFYFINQEVNDDVRATILSSFGASYSLVTLIMYPFYGLVGNSSGYQGIILITAVMTFPMFAYLFRFYKKYNVGVRAIVPREVTK
ncbi:hypothetical protein A3844_04300 [Paenibacillus helianthi]|uniref:MFS transporter n=1 Tax=Paenibacillus helianthi TaxID=1349432 RepID=A0ABX3ET02_9BACL|nr:MFS transporter [Paenibacillus helianthi]OKP91069.1 hypothetical protein A3844_04300 [Paenibacillus helianthi]